MRQMVLNHASVHAPNVKRQTVLDWLLDIAKGVAELIRGRVVEPTWRTRRPLEEIFCLANYSLADALWELTGRDREASRHLLRLATKTPLWAEAGAEVQDRFHACEHQSLSTDQGEPLVLCAIAGWIAVGFPSSSKWDRDRLSVEFNELLPDESWNLASEDIDNLTRSTHAGAIRERHQERLARGSAPHSLWENREQAFPNLPLGPDVEQNLKDQASNFTAIVGKLISLDRAAAAWKAEGGPAPAWPIKVTDEANLTPQLRERRRFRSHNGTHPLFTWHARFGGSGRIHLRFDAATREVEIGYIGPHLPLSS